MPVGCVRGRDVKVDIPESWISLNRRSMKLSLRNGQTLVIFVGRPGAIWALKLKTGRSRDLTDLSAIYDAEFESKEVIELFRSLETDALVAKLRSVLLKIESEKLFEDSITTVAPSPKRILSSLAYLL